MAGTEGGVASGSVSGTATTQAQVDELVRAADAAARAASPAPDANPLVADRPVAADWDDAPLPTDIHVYDTFAPALGEAFGRATAGDRILYGFVNHELTTTYLGSSTGLRLRHVQPTGHYGCTGKDVGLTTSAWVGGATRDFTDVDALEMEQTVTTRLGWGARRLDLPAGRYDTILPPSAVADLMIDAYWYASARDAWEGQSVYSRHGAGTRIGESIVDPRVTLFSDPGYHGLQCAPFTVAGASGNDTVGLRQRASAARTDWIRGGELTALRQTRHSAAMTSQPVTPAIDNLALTIDGAGGSVDDLVASTERGLLLTCLWYIREVDPQSLLLTGLTRDGVYLVEGGEITGAVNNFRWNESPVDLLRRFTAASSHRAELQPGVGRRLLLPHGDAGSARARLQHVERLASALTPGPAIRRTGPVTPHYSRGVCLDRDCSLGGIFTMAPRADLWRFVRPLVLVTVALVGVGLLTPATAQARTPLPREDRFDVYAGSTIRLDVLANDSVLGNGTLTVCEVNVADRDTQVIYAGAATDHVLVDVRPFTQGRVTFTYRACQGDDRSAPSRVTLAITSLATVKVTKRQGYKGQIVARNPNDEDLMIRWGSTSSGRSDGSRKLPGNSQIVIKTKRTSVFWTAYLDYSGTTAGAGSGDVDKIAQPKKRNRRR